MGDPIRRLVYDVGMHEGEDSEFYFARGFDVIGVEANPHLVIRLRERFAKEIATGRLRLIDKAVGLDEGKVQFSINRAATIWGSVDPKFVARNAAIGAGDTTIVEVDAIPFSDILREFGIPYYLKVDIEGMDMACIRALHEFNVRPRYISLESAVTSGVADVESAFGELAELWSLGYRKFKYVDQASLTKLTGCTIDREGPAMTYEYRKHSSGPFGEETSGGWHSVDAILRQMRWLIRYQNALGLGGRHHARLASKVGRRLWRKCRRLSSHSWYDLHARIGGGD